MSAIEEAFEKYVSAEVGFFDDYDAFKQGYLAGLERAAKVCDEGKYDLAGFAAEAIRQLAKEE